MPSPFFFFQLRRIPGEDLSSPPLSKAGKVSREEAPSFPFLVANNSEAAPPCGWLSGVFSLLRKTDLRQKQKPFFFGGSGPFPFYGKYSDALYLPLPRFLEGCSSVADSEAHCPLFPLSFHFIGRISFFPQPQIESDSFLFLFPSRERSSDPPFLSLVPSQRGFRFSIKEQYILVPCLLFSYPYSGGIYGAPPTPFLFFCPLFCPGLSPFGPSGTSPFCAKVNGFAYTQRIHFSLPFFSFPFDKGVLFSCVPAPRSYSGNTPSSFFPFSL